MRVWQGARSVLVHVVQQHLQRVYLHRSMSAPAARYSNIYIFHERIASYSHQELRESPLS